MPPKRSTNTPADGRKRGWPFTLNNYTEQEIAKLAEIGRNPQTIWLIYGLEVGEVCHTPHIQGFIYFKNAVRMSTLKVLLPRARWLPDECRGSFADQRSYCSKGEQPKAEYEELRSLGPNWGKNAKVTEFGTQPMDASSRQAKGGQATKDLFEQTLALAKEGRFSEISAEHLIKYHGSLKRIHMDYGPPPVELDGVCGLWLYGKPWTGKSKFSRDKFGKAMDGTLFSKDKNKWWDGYAGEPYVLVDDLTPDIRNLHSIADRIKVWCDMYPMNAEVKGGYIKIRPKLVIFTSNYTVRECFAQLHDKVLMQAVRRRFTMINFNDVFNVRDIPEMFRNHADEDALDYTYDPYDPVKVERALPDHIRFLGKILDPEAQPPTTLPTIPEVQVDTELDDFDFSDLDLDDFSLSNFSATESHAPPVQSESTTLQRTNAIQSFGRSTTSGLLSGLLQAAGSPLTPPRKTVSTAGPRFAPPALATGRLTSASAVPQPNLKRTSSQAFSDSDDGGEMDICEDWDLNHRAGDYVHDDWLVPDHEEPEEYETLTASSQGSGSQSSRLKLPPPKRNKINIFDDSDTD